MNLPLLSVTLMRKLGAEDTDGCSMARRPPDWRQAITDDAIPAVAPGTQGTKGQGAIDAARSDAADSRAITHGPGNTRQEIDGRCGVKRLLSAG